jgi:hypothetical protein
LKAREKGERRKEKAVAGTPSFLFSLFSFLLSLSSFLFPPFSFS